MKGTDWSSTPRAVVATRDEAVAQFIAVHLRDRGFAVELAHRAEYLRSVAFDLDLLIADVEFFQDADLDHHHTPNEVIILSANANETEEEALRLAGITAYFAIPFDAPAAFASTLDSITARSAERRTAAVTTPV